MISSRKALFFLHCCIAIAGFHVPGAIAQAAKVDVCHIPPGNPDNAHTITISINALETHLNHGDSIGTCEPEQPPEETPPAGQAPKVGVCHIPPGNPENAHTITISENALDAHLAHGDHTGACEPAQTPEVPPPAAQTAKVDVCHIPPGNPENAHTITISENALDAHLAHGDSIGTCEPREPVGEGDPVRPTPTPSACICPRPGVWRVTNLEGWMECNVLGIKRKLKGAGRNDGAIWILNEDCSTIFGEAYEKHREDVLLDRGRDCLYFGAALGEEDGAEAIFDGAYRIETEEFITGEYYMEMSSIGADCSGYRPFEIEFVEPLSEKDYAKLEKKMQEQLEEVRKSIDEHREQIDAYLEKTDGGKAFGGRKE